MRSRRVRCSKTVAVPAVLFALVFLGPDSVAQSRWWLDEPIRFLQTNLSETDSTVDPKALVAAVAEFPANTFLVNMGGIVAQYPTRCRFTTRARSCRRAAICSATCCARRAPAAFASSAASI